MSDELDIDPKTYALSAKPAWKCPGCGGHFPRKADPHRCVSGYTKNWKHLRKQGKLWEPVQPVAERLVRNLLETDHVDPKAYALQHGLGHRIKISYHLITPTSAQQGDYAESGWEDEEGHDCEPHDDEDDDAAYTAARYLQQHSSETSSSTFHVGMWYTSRHDDFRTGEIRERNYHLSGFTPEEEERVYKHWKLTI